MKETPIARSDGWNTRLDPDTRIVELERIGGNDRISLTISEVYELWRLLGKVNGYLNPYRAEADELPLPAKKKG